MLRSNIALERIMFMRFSCLAALLGLVLLVPACSQGSRKPVHPVRGQVLLAGKPVAQAIVTFHADGAGEPAPSAQTDDQGYFTLTSYTKGDGAPEGEYRV